MPNLVTVKLYLQIKVIPLSMSLMLNTKASVNSCLVFLKGKKETRWILLVWILIVSNIYDPCLCKSWTQWSPISMLDLRFVKRKRKQTSKPGRKVPNEIPSSIEFWIEEGRKKLVKLKWKSKKKLSETTNWLRLRSHHTSFKSCRRFVPFCSYTMKIHTDTDSTS